MTNIKYLLAHEDAKRLIKNLLAGPEHGHIGFMASSVDRDNYKRLFTRDAFWIGMAALLSGDADLISGFKNSLETLMNTQRKDGAIPSNVSADGHISYGIINPRIDANTLYIIGCLEYYNRTNDAKTFEKFIPSIKKTIQYLEKTWECKKCGLLYIPRAGNWADEYLQRGFVLYDEVLWYIALKKFGCYLRTLQDKRSGDYIQKSKKIKKLIKDKFWIKNSITKKDNIYLKMRKKIDLEQSGYFMHFYYANSRNDSSFSSSHGIFDAFGNALAIVAGVASARQAEKISRFIDEVSINRYPLIPAHYPFFSESVFKSKKLYQYRFKEYIGHYHNGGLWPWYTGIYVAAFAALGDTERALKFLKGILNANLTERDAMNYYEYHTGRSATARVKIVHPRGIDLYLSKILKDIALSQKPTVQIKHDKNFVYIDDNISLRSLGAKKGDTIEFTAFGPNAEDVLSGISALKDKQNTRYFSKIDISSVASHPDGTPYMGVSAAAYIIGYKTLSEKKSLFRDGV